MFEQEWGASDRAFEVDDLAQTAFRDEPTEGQEVSIPATIMKDGEQAPLPVGLFRHPFRVRQGRRERLVDQYMPAATKSSQRMLGVHRVRGGNHHQIDGGLRQQRVDARDHTDLGQIRQCLPGIS